MSLALCPHVVSQPPERFRSSETRAGCCQNGGKWKIGHCSNAVQGKIGHCSKTVQGKIGHCSKTVQGITCSCTLVFVTHRQGSSCKRSPAGCQPECVRNAPIVEISLDTWGLARAQQLVLWTLSSWLHSPLLVTEQDAKCTSCFALAGSPPP